VPHVTETPLPASEGALRRTAEELGDYVGEVGGLLLRYACPAYRVEALIRVVADLEGYDADAFALPTGLFVTITPREGRRAPVHRMVRARDWRIDLERLLYVDAIFNEVADGRRTIESARAALGGLEQRLGGYGALTRWLAVALTSASAGWLFGGLPVDGALAAAVGLVVHALGRLLGSHPQARFLHDFVGALAAALVTGLVGYVLPQASRDAVLLGGMISLFPGMTFTTGLAEVAHKNLVAGAARLMEALVTFLAMVFGIALAIATARALDLGTPDPPAPVAFDALRRVVAVLGASLGLGIAFNVPRGLLWTAVVSGATSYGVSLLAARHLPSHIAAFLAATTLCAVANLLARFTLRPAQLFHLPGMMLLVPGSLGFLGLGDFLRGTYTSGTEKLVSMLLVAGGLVMGVLVANVVVPPRKLL
jgi:uncharacterized membrane protein YjjP (DUF1212 family)